MRYTHSEVELRKCCLGQSAKSKIPYHLIIHDKACQYNAADLWFSPGTPVSSTNKTDRHDTAEIFFESGIKHYKTNQPTN